MYRIPFNRPCYTGNEDRHVLQAMRSHCISGNGPFARRCEKWFEERLGCSRAFLTSSGTHALEMCALLADIQPGDEVIIPSFTFVSTATAFALRGARMVFVDIEPDTMNLQADQVEKAITGKTRAVVVVHYGGVACDVEKISRLCRQHNLFLIEDAAHAFMANFDGRPLGTFGQLACFSFHETKNITSGGEGGLLIVNEPRLVERAEIIREKGTNRNRFFRGEVDKYTWVDLGSSYLMNDVSAAYLWGQLEMADRITEFRKNRWQLYKTLLQETEASGKISTPSIPPRRTHNGHIFHIKTGGAEERARLIEHLKSKGILAVFHYVPLHSSPAGLKYGFFCGEDRFTTRESERLLRLPLFYGIREEEIQEVVTAIRDFYAGIRK